MDGGNYDWLKEEEIERFAVEWRRQAQYVEFVGEPDPFEELRNRVNRGRLLGFHKRSVEAYLKKHDARTYKLSTDAKADREDRAVAAAERSAKWAGWAIPISLAALALAGWPYIKAALE